eukprot:jgi/Bigna1/82854/fgenesh1_pg.98_\
MSDNKTEVQAMAATEKNDAAKTAAVTKEPAAISCLSRVQAPMQAFFRPGMWLPGCRNIRYYSETWALGVKAEVAMKAFLKTVKHYEENTDGVMGKEKILCVHVTGGDKAVRVTCFVLF